MSDVIPKNPTHVVITPATIRQSASGTLPKLTLTPGTSLRLISTKDGCALVARDGKKLGYVEARVLATLQ